MTTDNETEKLIVHSGKRAKAYEIELTPALAAKLLEKMAGAQRPLKTARLIKYGKMVEDHDWPYTGQGLVIGTDGSLLNGAHTCTAVFRTGISIPRILVVLGVDPEVFNHFDDVALRSPADNLPPGTANRNNVAAVLGALWREERNRMQSLGQMPGKDAPAMFKKYPTVGDSVLAAHGCRAVVSQSIAAYTHYRACYANKEKADLFISRLADGEMLSKTSPLYVLRERLILRRVEKGKLSPTEVLALCIKAWTKFLNDEPAKALVWRNAGPAPEPFPAWPGPPLADITPKKRRGRPVKRPLR